MDPRERLSALARMESATAPVVSVYLNTRWDDEHQRERVRIFLKNELRRARAGSGSRPLPEDLEWVEQRGEEIVQQAVVPDAHGIALFACAPLGLREVLPFRIPFDNTFMVADRPVLTPLAELLEEAPAGVVAFVSGESARLIALDSRGRGDEVRLAHEVPGRHSRGSWAQLAQSRYKHHIEAHRDQHFQAVVEALRGLVRPGARIVLAGEPRAVAVFRKHLPGPLQSLVAGSIAAADHEEASLLAERAADLLARLEASDQARAVDEVLTEAAKGRNGVAGTEATLDAVARGAIHRLYVLKGVQVAGAACGRCGSLQSGATPRCRACGGATTTVGLIDAIVERVVAAGGEVRVIDHHAGLARAGGMAAVLRFPV
jgi:peptide subunit release factor 1 (eRF1)